MHSPARSPAAETGLSNLPPELLAHIHGRLSFLDRLAFAAAVSAPCRAAFKPHSPWLVLPGESPATSTIFSVADRRSATARASDPAMRDYVIIGSSCGWIVTADERGPMRLANPVTGEQGDLPAISTIPFLADRGDHFTMAMEPFLQIRYRGDLETLALHPHRRGTFTHTAGQMRQWFYRKVVLSASPRAGEGYAAMLLLQNPFAAPAFATAEDGRWRLAPSRDGVEDAIHHHRGKFFSVTFTGVVEEWERDGVDGEFKSKVVTTRMDSGDGDEHRKYLAAAPDGRLMIVVENTKKSSSRWACSFTVQVFDEMTQRWEVAKDIGDLALLVGINSSMCVSTTKHPELKAGCVYYTDDEMGKASLRKGAGAARRISDHHDDDRRRNVGVYRLKDGAVGNMAGLGQHKSWPPPAWFTPCFP